VYTFLVFEALFHNISDQDKNDAIESIIQRATPRQDFFLVLTLALAMAAFGILLGSTIILIGSMLIAPLLYPLLSLSLGVVTSDNKLIMRAVVTLVKSIGIGLGSAFVIGFVFAGSAVETFPFYVAVGGSSSLMYAIVAAIAGFAAAFAMTKPHLNESLPGVAIAVALVPPLAFAGVALSSFNWPVFLNSTLLFLVNVIGIMFSAMIVFSMLRFSVKKRVTTEVVKEEQKIIQKESEATSS
jgi:uncharacterized hydrophobic protein (TIGR00271 family)